MNENVNGFHGLGIAPKFLEILAKNNFTQPTPIQNQSIPVAIQGKDIIGIAQTGTGKTLAFGIPMLQNMVKNKGKGLVLLPTRELALQVEESIMKIGRSLGLRTVVLIGGEDIKRQIRKLRQDPHVYIATPGRLNDHLTQKTAKLDAVKVLVLDEADRMLDMGFAPQIKKIVDKIPADRQTMLFSATMPQEIVALAKSYMKLPVRVEVAPAGTTSKDVAQELIFVDKHDKPHILSGLLDKHKGSVLVFTRTKYEAKKVAKLVRDFKHTAAEIHSNRSLAQRREALSGFKLGKYRVLVATDIAARGIDVTGIELVVNYDLPANGEDYVHRIGRTGRAGSNGRAISLAMPHQRADVRSIERVIKMALPISEHGLKVSGARQSYRESKPARMRTPNRAMGRTPQESRTHYSRPAKSNRFGNKRRDSKHKPVIPSHFPKDEPFSSFYMTRSGK
jgi:ATP-dependent RNA helicase RhlE